MDRYHRQTILPQVNDAGRRRLAAAGVLVVGVGALGSVTAESLVRAGVGRVTLADRDLVELTNLQRQTLFDEASVGTPKAVAAAGRLAAVNGGVSVRPLVVDVGPDNVERIIESCGATLLLDGTDNAATRYLLNDVAVKRGLPWAYGGCVGVEGRVMPVVPGDGPCLRCVFPDPPAAGETATCDTNGVLGPAAGVVANLQAAAAIRLIVSGTAERKLVTVDAWTMRVREIDVADARRPDCPACGLGRFDFLNAAAQQAATLCGRDSVQVRPPVASDDFSLDRAEARLADRFAPTRTPYLLSLSPEPGIGLTLFADGRTLVHGTGDPSRARAIVAKYLG